MFGWLTGSASVECTGDYDSTIHPGKKGIMTDPIEAPAAVFYVRKVDTRHRLVEQKPFTVYVFYTRCEHELKVSHSTAEQYFQTLPMLHAGHDAREVSRPLARYGPFFDIYCIHVHTFSEPHCIIRCSISACGNETGR